LKIGESVETLEAGAVETVVLESYSDCVVRKYECLLWISGCIYN